MSRYEFAVWSLHTLFDCNKKIHLRSFCFFLMWLLQSLFLRADVAGSLIVRDLFTLFEARRAFPYSCGILPPLYSAQLASYAPRCHVTQELLRNRKYGCGKGLERQPRRKLGQRERSRLTLHNSTPSHLYSATGCGRQLTRTQDHEEAVWDNSGIRT